MNKHTRIVYEKAVSLLFPRRCPYCDEVLRPGLYYHESCRNKADYADNYSTCIQCGRPLFYSDDEYCRVCKGKDFYFDKGYSLYVYKAVSPGIYRLKYAGRREYADVYAMDMVRCLGERIDSLDADLIVPVPLHARRMRTRGYNQAALLGRALSKRTGIACSEALARRVRNTAPQKLLTAAGRRRNLSGAFKLSGNDVKLKKIIIIDDIYTTGATVNELAKELKKAGASKVYVITLAIGSI
ncbi:ComF family protein [Butyrivibrio sp. MC2013]|uniref:ComF family protein n=1 Tax=Butyrivibrio sp. MC2013 TaxID=1280686 RepID=UPI00047A4127|nr:ComF family protein [Butyrivibrio sp. MC2013]